jgi:methylthioribose-1-phosphate isomerase
MNVHGKHYRTIWQKPGNDRVVEIIDQRALPHRFVIEKISTVAQMAAAIFEMHVRGAGLIGASAGWGMYLAALEASRSRALDRRLAESGATLKATRPTAVNLAWAARRHRARLDRERKDRHRTRDRRFDRR